MSKKYSLSESHLFTTVDVYSLGILLPIILSRQMIAHDITLEKMSIILDSKKIKEYLDLFKPFDIYEMYK